VTGDPAEKKPINRMSLSFIMVAFIVVAVVAAGTAPWAPVVVLVIAVLGAAFLWNRFRPHSGTGMGILSTNCEKCGGLLRGVMGFSQKTCPQCGHVQSWGH
jgi:hypothetical protein